MNFWVLKRKIHSSWQVVIISVSLFLGVVSAKYFRVPDEYIIWVMLICCVLFALCFWKRYLYVTPILIIAGFMFGLGRGSMVQSDLRVYKPLYGKIISVSGDVTDDVDIDNNGLMTIRLGDLIFKDQKMSGVLWLTASSENKDIKRGDNITIKGLLKKGFGSFAGVMYRASVDNINHIEPGDVARVVRDRFADGVRVALPDPEASLGIGYLVGQRRALPADLVTALQIVGLTHIVVASGYNLTILVRLTRRLFVKISKYLTTLSAGLMIFGFIAVTGASPSMVRAGLVSALSLIAWYYGRKFHPIVLLSVAIGITVLINPFYAWGDLGWQLSFAAFAGVMILAPLASRYLFGDKKLNTISQILVETISAQIMTMPIIIMAFGQISNVAIITNLLVLPLVPLAMLFTFIAGLGGLFLPVIASVIGLPAKWILSYMIGVVNNFASLPWAVSSVDISWFVFGISYLLIIAACFYMWRVTKYNLRDSNLIE